MCLFLPRSSSRAAVHPSLRSLAACGVCVGALGLLRIGGARRACALRLCPRFALLIPAVHAAPRPLSPGTRFDLFVARRPLFGRGPWACQLEGGSCDDLAALFLGVGRGQPDMGLTFRSLGVCGFAHAPPVRAGTLSALGAAAAILVEVSGQTGFTTVCGAQLRASFASPGLSLAFGQGVRSGLIPSELFRLSRSRPHACVPIVCSLACAGRGRCAGCCHPGALRRRVCCDPTSPALGLRSRVCGAGVRACCFAPERRLLCAGLL